MRSMIIIVDDFYRQPEKVRQRALKSRYANISKSDYPGFGSRLRLDAAAIRDSFSDLIGADLNLDSGRFSWGEFRFVTADSGRATKVHADVAVDWAGMVYLTPDLPPECGTGLFRHRETGFERPPSDREARGLGFRDAAEFDDEVIRRDKADLSRWELTSVIAPAYNRLILFRGAECYHAPIGGCGKDAETARLTHIFFFNERPPTQVKFAELDVIRTSSAGEPQ